jgi:low temperature requirement protein LtrA
VSRPERLAILRAGDGQVTNVELFFDLVYVFAVTQLSHLLVSHTTVDGTVRVAILLAIVWQAWIYTTWMTTYLDPSQTSVRVVLLAIMLGSLVLAAELPRAFGDRGLVIAGTYVAMQVGRALFTAIVLRGHELRLTFQRVSAWSSASGVVMILGALAHDHVREGVWVAAICIDLVGAAIGFWLPWLGRSITTDWTISGEHFAERCQAFVLIALGESIVVTGATFSGLVHPTHAEIAALVLAFAASVGLWWIYFDRVAADSSRVIAESSDPGRLGRNAFHWVHPLIVFGIIVTAAGDEIVLADPHASSTTATTWLVLGGVALYLFGHALFKAIVWRVTAWSRLAGIVALALFFPLAQHLSALALGAATLLVILGVAVADRVQGHAVSSPLPDGS